jgi:hypothetical protein
MLKIFRRFVVAAVIAVTCSQAARANTYYVWAIDVVFAPLNSLNVVSSFYHVTGTVTYGLDEGTIVDWNITDDGPGLTFTSDETFTSSPSSTFGSYSDIGGILGGSDYVFGTDDGLATLDLMFSGDFTDDHIFVIGYKEYNPLDTDAAINSGTAELIATFSTSVPEPASLALFGMGIVFLGSKLRRGLYQRRAGLVQAEG